MLEIIAFIAIAAYSCTLPGRVRRALRGEPPPKFKGDAARYLANLQRESLIIVVCAAIWSVKDIADVFWLRADDVADSGAGPLLWVIIAGWLACAVGAFIARRPLLAAGGPTPTPAAE